MPLHDYQEGWRFHRVRTSMPSFVRAVPASSVMNVPRDRDLSFQFFHPIGFANSKGKTIRLYEAVDINTVDWQADPGPGHPTEGTEQITFDDLPQLKPNTSDSVLSDNGWITLAGKRAIGLNAGAFWYRFRTGKK